MTTTVEVNSLPAAPTLGDGTVNDPYRIANICNLAWMSNDASNSSGTYYKMTADIDASDTAYWNDTSTSTDILEGFKPIGDSTDEFQGYFDGDNYSITGLVINRPYPSAGYDDVGLFGRVSYPAHVRNLSLDGGSILGESNVGGLVGYLMSYGEVLHCNASCAIAANGSNAGGLIGYEDAGDVSNCYATGNVTAAVDNAGGLIGFADGGWVGEFISF
jgi:hypothetical protein